MRLRVAVLPVRPGRRPIQAQRSLPSSFSLTPTWARDGLASSAQALSAGPGRGLRPLPPWQWIPNGWLPACDLTFPICKCKIKGPVHGTESAQPQAQSKRSEMAVLSLLRTNNTNSISGILPLANDDNRVPYLVGHGWFPLQGWKYVEWSWVERRSVNFSRPAPGSKWFRLRGSDVLSAPRLSS